MLPFTVSPPTVDVYPKRYPVTDQLLNCYLCQSKTFLRHPVSLELTTKYVSPVRKPTKKEFHALTPDIEKIISIESRRIPLYRLGFDLEDLIQEGKMQAWIAYLSYDPTKGTKLKTWVIKFIRQMLLNFGTKASKKKRKQVIHGDHQQYEWMECPEDVFAWELMEDLKSNLTEFEYKVLLCRLNGLGLKQIRQELGCRINSVWKAVRAFKAAVSCLLDLPIPQSTRKVS